MTLLDSKLEEKIKLRAFEYLKRGKETWDIPHTLSAVHYVRELIKKEGGDEKILVTTMYFHDTGYPALAKDYDFGDLLDAKKNDTLDKLDSFNRQLVMEADSLAALDWERTVPNFDKENCAKYLDYFKKNRPEKFLTETGKILLDKLLRKAEEYIKE